MAREWRLECDLCDTGYRKMHTELTDRELEDLDVDADGGTVVRCNNCRGIRRVD